MCGICGFTIPADFDENNDYNAMETIKHMSAVMYHRGPDGFGHFVNERIAFGHRRLSFIDMECGMQPMTRGVSPSDAAHTDSAGMQQDIENNGTVIVFNGEIYNYRELRTELENAGYVFSTRSDTEVLLACWIQWGKDCLKWLRGMFAFAVYEPLSNRITLVRDRFGIKPLYWTIDSKGALVFASEAKSLFEHPYVNKTLDRGQLDHYLSFQYSVGERTFFKGIYKLTPGSLLEFDLSNTSIGEHELPVTVQNYESIEWIPNSVKIARWWEPEYSVDNTMEIGTASDMIADVFDDSIKHHRIADVEVGMLLSGGVDSSYVASSLSKQQESVRAFTVGFAETDERHKYTEIDEAVETSSDIGTGHDVKEIKVEEYWDAVPRIQWHMDEPNADPAAVALFFADNLASKKVKAVMSGEGADELFGGYQIYNTAVSSHKLDFIPRPLLGFAYRLAKRFNIRGHHYLERAYKGPEGTFIGNAYLFTESERKNILKQPTENSAAPSDVVKRLYDKAAYMHLPDDALRMQYIDMNTWLIGDILQKTDRMSMANSVEARVPFLDIDVWNVAKLLPINCRVDGHQTKIALRKAAARTVNDSAANRPKLGFPVPMRVWLCQDRWYGKVSEAFSGDTAREFFNIDAIMSLLEEHRNNQCDNSRKIWAIYAFITWYDVYFKGKGDCFRNETINKAKEIG